MSGIKDKIKFNGDIWMVQGTKFGNPEIVSFDNRNNKICELPNMNEESEATAKLIENVQLLFWIVVVHASNSGSSYLFDVVETIIGYRPTYIEMLELAEIAKKMIGEEIETWTKKY